jgi:hypothetical protein
MLNTKPFAMRSAALAERNCQALSCTQRLGRAVCAKLSLPKQV